MIFDYNQLKVFELVPILKTLGYIEQSLTDDVINEYKETHLSNRITTITDRTGQIQQLLPVSIVSPMPSAVQGFSKTFKQICFERAKELLSIGKRLNILWSGGIDSTTVLLALIACATDNKQIRVICTHTSIVESGNVFDTHIKGNVDLVLNTPMAKSDFFKLYSFDPTEELFVTGDCADQLVIQSFNRPIIKDDLFLPYQEVVESGRSPISASKLKFIQPAINVAPRPIVTHRDLLWFYRFNFQYMKSRNSFFLGKTPEQQSMVNVFFNTEDFQQWSIADLEESQEPFEHKISYRHFIHSITNSEYAYKKQKTASSAWLHNNYNDVIFYLADGTIKTEFDIYKEMRETK